MDTVERLPQYPATVPPRVVLIQPYVPEYRVPLFAKLSELLRQDGVDFRVLVGRPTSGQAAQRDAYSMRDGTYQVPSHSLILWGHEARYRRIGTWARTASLVICEHASGALETYVWGLRRRPPIALWGHGRAFVTRPNRWDSALEGLQLRAAKHYFAYTQQGADAVAEAGFPASQVSVFNNSTDTVALRRLLDSVTAADVERTRRELSLASERIVLVLGSLNESKRVGLSLEVLKRLSRLHPDVALVFVGAGPLVPEVLETEASGNLVRWAGRRTGPELAALGATSEFILNPGRVGLVATDSFALGLPIVTTRWDRHAPEFAYLTHGLNALILEDSVEALVEGADTLLSGRDLLDTLRNGCGASLNMYSMERSAEAIRAGIRTALQG